jgi:hypothetical protein
MDLNDYWQENKRFVTIVVAGLVVFLIGYAVLKSQYGDDIRDNRKAINRLRTDLAKEMHTSSDLAVAQGENDELLAAVEVLHDAVHFQPRPEFLLDETLGSFPNQYLRALTRVREDLLPQANRANLTLDPGLGMPKLSPTRDAEIVRYLEALDVIETVVGMAVDAKVQRIEKITIRLDPGLSTRAGLGAVERTRVKFDVRGNSLALTRLLASTQRSADGRVLHLDDMEMVPSRNKTDEVRLTLTLTIARLSEVVTEES